MWLWAGFCWWRTSNNQMTLVVWIFDSDWLASEGHTYIVSTIKIKKKRETRLVDQYSVLCIQRMGFMQPVRLSRRHKYAMRGQRGYMIWQFRVISQTVCRRRQWSAGAGLLESSPEVPFPQIMTSKSSWGGGGGGEVFTPCYLCIWSFRSFIPLPS